MTILRLLPLLLLCACNAMSPIEDDIAYFDMKHADASAMCPAPADIATAVGSYCESEGVSCGACTDPCQFCNEIQCQGSRWISVESFPELCDGGAPDGG